MYHGTVKWFNETKGFGFKHENMIINKSGIAIMMIGLEAISRELMTEKEQVIQATKIIAELNGAVPFAVFRQCGPA